MTMERVTSKVSEIVQEMTTAEIRWLIGLLKEEVE